MNLFQKGKQYIFKKLSASPPALPADAYNLWAENYDHQPDNLMLALDEEIFSGLINPLSLQQKIIADIGCGTGRHWAKILDKKPQRLIGFDVSEGMLKILQQKFPVAETHHLADDELRGLKNESCDMIFSTLTIAHIENAQRAMAEWNRVLKPGGSIVITDYHPYALAKGGRRTFSYMGKTIEVKNYVHPVEKIKEISRQLHLEVFRLVEKSIDESAKPFYEKQNAIVVYEAWKGTPIIYGIHLKKPDVVK